MKTPRPLLERVEMLERFAARVDALSPAAWQRLKDRCAPLAGSSPTALYRRAALSGAAFELPRFPDPPLPVRAIVLAQRTFTVGIGLSFEMITSAFPSTVEPPWTRRTASARPEFDRSIDAHNAIEHAMERNGMRIPSVWTALRASTEALWRRDWIADDTFWSIYRYVDAEIPYALVDPAANAATPASG
jgi:hypothetical protein